MKSTTRRSPPGIERAAHRRQGGRSGRQIGVMPENVNAERPGQGLDQHVPRRRPDRASRPGSPTANPFDQGIAEPALVVQPDRGGIDADFPERRRRQRRGWAGTSGCSRGLRRRAGSCPREPRRGRARPCPGPRGNASSLPSPPPPDPQIALDHDDDFGVADFGPRRDRLANCASARPAARPSPGPRCSRAASRWCTWRSNVRPKRAISRPPQRNHRMPPRRRGRYGSRVSSINRFAGPGREERKAGATERQDPATTGEGKPFLPARPFDRPAQRQTFLRPGDRTNAVCGNAPYRVPDLRAASPTATWTGAPTGLRST